MAALGDRLKNAVDYLTPMMALQAELARHGANLFRVDRSHANDLGQAVMACLFLRGQGLPVGIPSAEDILMGWREQPLSESLRARRDAGVRWRDLTWVYPHQQDRTRGLSLCERIAFWKKELSRTDLPPYFVRMYENYVENAESEPALFGEYMALSDALYTSGSIGGEGELLRI